MVQTRAAETETLSVREAINEALHEELAREDRVVVMGEDIGETGHVNNLTEGLWERFGGDRVIDTPLAESALLGSAVGAAATGLRPVADMMFSDFMGVSGEQALNQMTKMYYMFGGKSPLPLVVRASEGAGLNAAAQHSKTVHTLFAHMAGAKAVAPGTPAAAKGLLKAAIRSDDPIFYFDNKLTYGERGEVPVDESFTVPIGEAAVERSGEDVTVVATQRFVGQSLEVAESLAGEISVEVLDLRSLYPLDTDTVADSVRKTGRLVVADESPLSYGTHAEVLARVNETAFWSLDAPMQRVGVPDTPIPFSPPLEDEVVPGAEAVRAAVERIVP